MPQNKSKSYFNELRALQYRVFRLQFYFYWFIEKVDLFAAALKKKKV
jgi:hypothetical protein